MTIGEWAARLRYRYVPDHLVGEVLGRRWMDNVIPVTLLIALTIYLIATIPNFLSAGNLSDTSRQIGEFGLIVIGMTIVMLARRHRSERRLELRARQSDRVGSDQCREMAGWRRRSRRRSASARWSASINGLLIGFLRLRAFLTTLVMLTLIRAIVELLLQRYSVQIASSDVESDVWDFVGAGSVLGAPFSLVVLVVIGDRRAMSS